MFATDNEYWDGYVATQEDNQKNYEHWKKMDVQNTAFQEK